MQTDNLKDGKVEITEDESKLDLKVIIPGKPIFSQQSKYHKVDIIENVQWGKILYLDQFQHFNEVD